MKPFYTALIALTTTLSAIAEDITNSVIRVASTRQSYNPSQPWDKTSPRKRRALAAVLPNSQVLTTAEMVTNANFIQLESSNGEHKLPAEVLAIDYEANLALLTPSTDEGKETLSKFTALQLSPAAHLGDTVNIVQIEDNGMALVTPGKIQGADVVSSFVAGHYFLTYEVKASMQSAASSFTVPVLKDGKLLGLLTSYSSKDQLVDIIAPEIIHAFLEDAKDGEYVGFPSLGIGTSRTTDIHFRDWLKLSSDKGGLYITRVLPNSAADQAGIKQGDVLTSINGKPLDRRGYYQANGYGQLFWSHLIRGSHPVGSTLKLGLLRDGKPLEVTTTLKRAPEGIIPSHTYGKAPRYLVKGGLVFQELTKSYLQAFGEDWASRAPLNLLDALNHPEDYEEGRKRLVFISAAIPTPATLGYESLRSVIVEKVNGQPIEDIPSLIAAFKQVPENGIHTLKLDGQPDTIYLDAKATDAVDKQLLLRGLPALSRDKE
ncbi:S1C family serine protease [Rubritalea tangerina]|uniref:PDZ domain-containing protein n=1 Tax=Rubritalea tangerina TaxID=430798 RepID=A0ABW4Z5T2_9BACT